MLESELRLDVLLAFTALTEATADLCDAVKQEKQLTAWVQDQDLSLLPIVQDSARERACAVISQFEYTMNQAPREILVCAGFIGASTSTINLAIAVNECKERFKNSILKLKGSKISHQDAFFAEKIDSILCRSPNTSKTLKKVGLARLHLKQCYRKIPLLSYPPQKISWTWAHTRSIKKISIEKAQELLLKKGSDPGIQIQLEKLNRLSQQEPLAIVQELAPHLRANIVYSTNNLIQRQMIKGPIPIFFPCEQNTPTPEFSPPHEKHGRDQNRSIRSDVKLDPNPFLSAIRAHRYINST